MDSDRPLRTGLGCLRIRRLGVRIPSGARSSEALFVIVEAPLLVLDDTFDDNSQHDQPRKAASVRVNHAGSSSQGKCPAPTYGWQLRSAGTGSDLGSSSSQTTPSATTTE